MRNLIRSVVGAAVAVTATTTALAATLEAKVDAYLRPYVETGNFAGSVLIGQGGEILLTKSYAMAVREPPRPNTPETAFRLASVSRVVTSAAILMLEEQGMLSVDDPLSRYLPDWPRADEITIHHLLTLSAGFPNINALAGYDEWSQKPQTATELAAKFRELPLEFAPGERTVHSNSNYVLLALLVERLSGKPFGDFLREKVFGPLGMTRSGHSGDRILPNGARGYQPIGLSGLEPAPTIDWTAKTGHGSLFSTTEDLYRLDRALASHHLLGAAAVENAFSEHFERHGYGWFVRERFGSREVYISGRSPGFGAYWGRSLDRDLTVIVLGNIYNSVPALVGPDLIALALDQPYEIPAIDTQPPDPALLAELVGEYQFGPEFYAPNAKIEFRAENGHLFSGPAWMMPAGGTRFVHRLYFSTLEFRRDGTGMIGELKFDEFVGRRLRGD